MAVVVLHTTESKAGTAKAVANYLRTKRSESHEVYDPSSDETVVLMRADQPARSLQNLPGGVETNRRGGVYQIEVVGHAADVAGYGEGWYQNLAKHVALVCFLTGTPLEFPHQFVAYPRPAYGLRSGHRMSGADWLVCRGVVGHQHVPENDHGDPGDISRMVAILTALTTEVYMSVPTGVLDQVVPDDGRIHVSGWAFDPDNSAASIRVDFHIWEAGSLRITALDANLLREDVNTVYGINGNHGFDGYVELPAMARPVTLIFYGIDNEGKENAELGRAAVEVTK